MIKAYCLFSGSRGNSYYLKNGDTEVLIDAGKSARALEAELSKIGTSKKNISATSTKVCQSSHQKIILLTTNVTK